MNILKRILRGLVFGVLALVLMFEEWGWEPLAKLFRQLAQQTLRQSSAGPQQVLQ